MDAIEAPINIPAQLVVRICMAFKSMSDQGYLCEDIDLMQDLDNALAIAELTINCCIICGSNNCNQGCLH